MQTTVAIGKMNDDIASPLCRKRKTNSDRKDDVFQVSARPVEACGWPVSASTALRGPKSVPHFRVHHQGVEWKTVNFCHCLSTSVLFIKFFPSCVCSLFVLLVSVAAAEVSTREAPRSDHFYMLSTEKAIAAKLSSASLHLNVSKVESVL